MTDETIVAVYDTASHAQAVMRDLVAAGVPDNAISMHAAAADRSSTGIVEPEREQGFWARLFGGEPDHDTAVYDRSMQSGSTVVTVRVPDTHINRVMDILDSHDPVDLDERAATYGMTQTDSTRAASVAPLGSGTTMSGTAMSGTTANATNDGTIRLSEERLSVGKRVVNRGGTRIRRFVVETPVEEQITLHDEKVILERRPVTGAQPVQGADFSEKVIEMTESSEEVVVAKNTFVKEEISLRKEATDRVETVRDTVRREDVEIEQIPGSATSTTTTTTKPVLPNTKI